MCRTAATVKSAVHIEQVQPEPTKLKDRETLHGQVLQKG